MILADGMARRTPNDRNTRNEDQLSDTPDFPQFYNLLRAQAVGERNQRIVIIVRQAGGCVDDGIARFHELLHPAHGVFGSEASLDVPRQAGHRPKVAADAVYAIALRAEVRGDSPSYLPGDAGDEHSHFSNP